MSVEEDKAIARQLLEELWSTGNVELADALFADDFIHHNVPEGTPRGPAGQKQFIPAVRATAPGLTIRIDDLIAESNRVAARWTGTYTTKDGERKSFQAVDILRIENGKIAELWSFVP